MGNASTEATIDIGLRPSNDTGAIVYRVPANRPGGLQNGYRILSVDGKNITGKSPDEIKALLKGPLGSRVNLQVLTNKGEVLTVSAVRELPGIHPPAGTEERQTATAAEKLDLYDYKFLPMPYAEAAQAGRSTVIEPFLTAQANIAATTTDLWFAKSIAAVSIYADLVMFYDRVGRIEQADELVAKVNSILRSLPSEDLRSWHAHDYAEYLQRSGRSAQSDQLNEILGKKSDNHQQVDANYALTANTLKAIQQKDTNTATDLINALIAHLEETGERASYHNRHQIWNCLTLIEKTYVDRGQTAAASKLRLRLMESAKCCQLSDSSLIPLQVDSCLMATPNGDANSWAQLEKSLVFAIPGTESLTITPAEKLRRFALAYTYTADYKRSRMLLNRAKTLATDSHSKANNIASALPSVSAHNEFVGDDTLTLIVLDNAIVDLLTDHFNEAQTAVNALLSSDAIIGQTAARKLAQIAYLYAQTSHEVDGEKLLTNLIEKSKAAPASDKNSRIAIPAFYQWKLGELLIKRGQDKEALPLIEAALAQYKKIGPYSGLLLPAAKLYERLGIYEKAATTFFDAQASLDPHSDYRVVDLRSAKQALLESALAAADKAHNLPDETKAKLVRAVANFTGNSNPARQRNLERQEMSLLKPGSPASVDLAISTVTRLKMRKAPSAEIIESLTAASDLAIKGNSPKAADILLELATAETSDNQMEKGIAHAVQALKMDRSSNRSNSAISMLTRPGQSIAETLYKTGHTVEAEALLKKAEAGDGTADSDKPYIAISSTASLISFYFKVGETKKAESLVNDLFAKYASSAKDNDPRYMSNQKSYAMTICRIAAGISNGPNKRVALDMVNRLLAEQRKLLMPNDLQLAETLKVIAQLYERSGQLTEAEATYREIMTLYTKHPNEHMDLGFRMQYGSLLQTLGKNDEASKLRDMR